MNLLVQLLFWHCKAGSLRDRALAVAFDHGPRSFRVAVLRLGGRA